MSKTATPAADPEPTTVDCTWCGEPFDVDTKRRGPVPKYCRPSHRQRMHEHTNFGMHPAGPPALRTATKKAAVKKTVTKKPTKKAAVKKAAARAR